MIEDAMIAMITTVESTLCNNHVEKNRDRGCVRRFRHNRFDRAVAVSKESRSTDQKTHRRVGSMQANEIAFESTGNCAKRISQRSRSPK
jgi:hypothetical protein